MNCTVCSGISRRTFLKFSMGAAGLAATNPWRALWSQDTVAAAAKTKACILLWMGGGPSQLDTFDPKPGRKTGGAFKAIPTNVRGLHFSEHLPRLAQVANKLSVIRTLSHTEGAHERGTYLMHTGYSPIGGLDFPPTGSVLSYELADKNFPLPNFVTVSSPQVPLSSIFGDEHLPFAIANIDNPIPNLMRPVEPEREKNRLALLAKQEEEFRGNREGRETTKHEVAYRKAEDLMTTPLLKAFNIHEEPEEVLKRYGQGFGRYCLLARRLVEAGVKCVEVSLGGWDTHQNNFELTQRNLLELDPAFSALIEDLSRSDLLQETLVVWAGEFGRTPEINPQNGRDHWTKSCAAVLAGGGIQGGRVIGETDKDGMEIANRPVTVPDFFATIYKCLGIDPEKKYAVEGRKVKYAYNGKPIKELF